MTTLTESPPFDLEPSDLPDLRLRLVDFWRTRLTSAKVNRYIGLPEWHFKALAAATLWWVGLDMVELVEAVAPTLPTDTTLDRTMVPDEIGFVHFARPMIARCDDSPDMTMALSGYLWWPGLVAEDRPYVDISAYSYAFDDVRVPLPWGIVHWPVGSTITESLPKEVSAQLTTIDDRRNLATIWLLSSQPGVVESRPALLARQTVRRSQRARVEPKVKVINLRSVPGTGKHGANSRAYHHRWFVSAHWRQQAYGPEHSLRRPVLITPYIKGPKGAPLLTTETVKAWVR